MLTPAEINEIDLMKRKQQWSDLTDLAVVSAPLLVALVGLLWFIFMGA